MLRSILLKACLLLTIAVNANTIIVKNIDELKAANKKAQPGDVIILQNGEWKDVNIKLDCDGTKEQPITFKAETAGKVLITGQSYLKLGGNYIVVDGFYFINGYAGKDAVITFCIDKNKLANNCRVTNSVVNDFNNPKRMDENYWVSFYGKNNRLDHCSFKEKKNMGVLLAVILDDDRSRENFHSIDHNYFGHRPPLASNSGEIIRVGVSQHCEFNSNTQIIDNFFEYCDGETEIVSIKSCSNVVRGNLFKESQGGVVLRHGNYNTVENNFFYGNGKEGTGGVRIINKGQWVVNNFFYKCRGVDFRSPLSLMNGIPNSPANRYVQVTDAMIANNTFYNCSSISFCEGSDTERTLPPANAMLLNNIFYNTTDPIIYKAFDDVKGITFLGNEVTTAVKQDLFSGFRKTSFASEKNEVVTLPRSLTKGAFAIPDSIQKAAQGRLNHGLSTKPGFSDLSLIKKIQTNATTACGAAWFKQLNIVKTEKPVLVNCQTAEDVYNALERKEPVIIKLTGSSYSVDKSFTINKTVQFTGDKKVEIKIKSDKTDAVFVIKGNGNLSLQNLNIDGAGVKADHFIASDDNGSSNHYNLVINNCIIKNLSRDNDCKNIFFAYKYMVADSIIIRNSSFLNNNNNGFFLKDEREDKGYYSAEKIFITNNSFSSQAGTLLDVYRGGNDESTMGPALIFANNKLTDCTDKGDDPVIHLFGTQRTMIEKNNFMNCNAGKTLVLYEDKVRAAHVIRNNNLHQSGKIMENKFVVNTNNRVD